MKRSKKRKRAGVLALVLAGILALGGSMAYFTDRETTSASGTAGSLDLEINGDGINLLDKDGLNILNPSDLRKVSYTVTEKGNKSVDVRETIKLSAVAADGKTITMTENSPELALYDVAYPGDDTALPADAAELTTRSVDVSKNTVTYKTAEYVLSGNSADGDAETDGDSNVKQHNYTLSFSGTANNSWQGSAITMEILVEGKQHRNTTSKWDTLATEKYVFSNGDEQSAIIKKTDPPKVTTLISGSAFNSKAKALAGGDLSNITSVVWGEAPTDNTASTSSGSSDSTTASADGVTAAVSPASLFVDTVYAADTTNNIMSTEDSKYPIIATYKDGTLYLSTDANKIYGNADMSDMFLNFKKLTSVDLSKIDTSNTTNMSNMFRECQSVTSLDTQDLNIDNVINMNSMFYGCNNIESIDVSNWNTSNVTDMSGMFAYCCNNLKTLDLSTFDMRKVTNVNNMFYGSKSIQSVDMNGWDLESLVNLPGIFTCGDYWGNNFYPTSLDCSNWKMPKVTSFKNLFYKQEKLTSLDISGWDTSNITDMAGMFSGCKKITNLDINGLNTSNVTDMTDMFCDCQSVTSLDTKHLDTSKVTNMSGMFRGCNNIQSIDVSGFDTSNVTDMSGMFAYCCNNLKTLDLSTFDMRKVTNVNNMFYGSKSIQSVDMNGWDLVSLVNLPGIFTKGDYWGDFNPMSLDCSNWKMPKVTSLQKLFYQQKKLQTVDISNWQTGDITTARDMFNDCNALTTIKSDADNFSTVTDYAGMFRGCNSLPSIDTATFFAGEKPEYMQWVFAGCSSMKTINLSPIDTSACKYFYHMFDGCSSLSSLDVSKFDFSSVEINTQYNEDVDYMFNGCSSLTSLNLSTFKMPNATNAQYMLANCTNLGNVTMNGIDMSKIQKLNNVFENDTALTSVDMSSVKFPAVTTMYRMFNNCSNLASIKFAENPDTTKLTNMEGMFLNCAKLTDANIDAVNSENVTTIEGIFYGCKAWTDDNIIGKMNTQNVSNMKSALQLTAITKFAPTDTVETSKLTRTDYFVAGCPSLASVDFTNMDTSNVTNMEGMFSDEAILDNPDLSQLKTGKVTTMRRMFMDWGGNKSRTINISNFDVSSLTDAWIMFGMFSGGGGRISKVYCDNDETSQKILGNNVDHQFIFWGTSLSGFSKTADAA